MKVRTPAAEKPAPKRRRAAGLATRARLIDAAAELFAARGADGASVRDVCRAARANVAAVTYHFGGKAGLYFETLRAGVAGMIARVEERRGPLEADPARRLVRHVRAFAAVMLATDAPTRPTRLMLVELARPTRALERLIAEFMKPTFDELRTTIAELAPPRTPKARLPLFALGVIAQIVHCKNAAPVVRAQLGYGAAFPAGFADRLADHVLAQLFVGIGRRDLLPLVGEAP